MQVRRVLYCEICEDGTTGGSHRSLVETVRGIDRTRFEPVVVFYEKNAFVAPLRELGARVHVWSEERRREKEPHEQGRPVGKVASVLGAVARRVRILRDERIDLVQLNNSPAMGFDDWLPAARIRRIPVLTRCAGEPYELPESRIKARLMANFDRILPVSRHAGERLVRGGFPAERILTVPSSIDVEHLRASVHRPPDEVRNRLGIGADEIVFAMVANIRDWKGQGVVLRALEALAAADRSRLRVLFIGTARREDAAFEKSLRDAVARARLEGSVEFLGWRDDVPDLLNAADVALHASILPEPSGNVLLEAMALGKPIVAANRGGPVEIVTDEAGLLFDPDDPGQLAAAMTRIAADPGLRARLGERGRERVELYSAPRMVARLESLYDELLEPKRGRAQGAS